MSPVMVGHQGGHQMPRRKTPQQREAAYQRQRRLENKVLAYLKERGPLPYDGLYVLFDLHRTAEIQPTLHELRQWEFITIEKGSPRTVSITSTGIKRLDEDHTLARHGFIGPERI